VENETKEVSICDPWLGGEKIVLLEGELWVPIYPLASRVDYFRSVLNRDMDVTKGFRNNSGDVTFRSPDL
jgi:hypothetical protein